jgi:hypothetical protein
MFKDSSARRYSRDIDIEYDARRAHHLLAEKREEVCVDARICKYASGFVLLASLGIAGCDNPNHHDGVGLVTGPFTGDVVTVEPVTVVPVFLSSPFCGALPLFQAGFTLVVHANSS